MLTYHEQLREECLDFGAHSGTPLADVPVGYLKWLADVSGVTLEKVKEYLEEYPKHEDTAYRHRNRDA